jgi:PIN domain nuclease of toxin-antitoxin system
MAKVVLDASAVLAVLHKEPGGDKVLTRLSEAIISAVNFAEVVSKLSNTGADLSQVLPDLHNLIRDIRPFDVMQAEAVGVLASLTRTHGLSLGDRACLTLGKSLNVPVLTTASGWSKLDLGIPIELIRGTSSQ